MDRLRVLTWHVHGSYLDSLIQTGHEFYLPVRGDRDGLHGGIGAWPWPRNRVHEVPEDHVRDLDVDVVLYQADENWFDDGPRILSDEQARGPRIYVEHDPPQRDPTAERHPVDDPDVLLVHVTAFNRLMWDSGRVPTTVIEHGVVVPPGVEWTGELERGIVVVNNIAKRGRRLGVDIVERGRATLPLDLVGMNAEAAGGIGEIPRTELAPFSARYRFYFHPIRYTSFGMALCEAMMIGLPIVGLATTEMPTVLENGRSGIIDTEPERLFDGARELLRDREYARRLGAAGREIARERFGIERFARDWDRAFREVAGRHGGRRGTHGRDVGRGTGSAAVPAGRPREEVRA